MKTILGLEKRMEKREALNVVPMIVRHQDMRFDSAVTLPTRPAIVHGVEVIAEHAEAGSAIENEMRAARDIDLEAGGIAAVAPGVALERRRGATHSPEGQFGAVLRHEGAVWSPLACRFPRFCGIRPQFHGRGGMVVSQLSFRSTPRETHVRMSAGLRPR